MSLLSLSTVPAFRVHTVKNPAETVPRDIIRVTRQPKLAYCRLFYIHELAGRYLKGKKKTTDTQHLPNHRNWLTSLDLAVTLIHITPAKQGTDPATMLSRLSLMGSSVPTSPNCFVQTHTCSAFSVSSLYAIDALAGSHTHTGMLTLAHVVGVDAGEHWLAPSMRRCAD
jgi:hypothetical protein